MGFWAWYELGIQFNVFPYGYQIFPKHLLKTALLWHLFHKSNAYICVNLVLHFLFCFTDLFVYSYANYYSKFSSVAQLCLTLHDPLDCSTPGFPVHCQLLELAQTHVHPVSDAIQPSHPLSSPYPPAFSLSQHQGLFKWVSSSHQVIKVLEFQLQHQSFQWIFSTDFL